MPLFGNRTTAEVAEDRLEKGKKLSDRQERARQFELKQERRKKDAKEKVDKTPAPARSVAKAREYGKADSEAIVEQTSILKSHAADIDRFEAWHAQNFWQVPSTELDIPKATIAVLAGIATGQSYIFKRPEALTVTLTGLIGLPAKASDKAEYATVVADLTTSVNATDGYAYKSEPGDILHITLKNLSSEGAASWTEMSLHGGVGFNRTSGQRIVDPTKIDAAFVASYAAVTIGSGNSKSTIVDVRLSRKLVGSIGTTIDQSRMIRAVMNVMAVDKWDSMGLIGALALGESAGKVVSELGAAFSS